MKQNKKWLKAGLLVGLVVFLTACASGPITPESTGFWDHYVLYNLSRFIIWLSNLFGGNYGIGIIIFTILIRILLLPLSKMQMDSSRKMQELQPELEALREEYSGRDRHTMEIYADKQQELFEENGINQFASLWPLLVQLPVMTALYQTISYTEVLKEGSFLWMNLGSMDPYFIMPVLAALLTFAATYFNMLSNPVESVATKVMMFIMPVMILFIGLSLPSAIGIYWVVTNAFTVAQTLIFQNPYKIIREREEKEKAERALERRLDREYRKATGRRRPR